MLSLPRLEFSGLYSHNTGIKVIADTRHVAPGGTNTSYHGLTLQHHLKQLIVGYPSYRTGIFGKYLQPVGQLHGRPDVQNTRRLPMKLTRVLLHTHAPLDIATGMFLTTRPSLTSGLSMTAISTTTRHSPSTRARQ